MQEHHSGGAVAGRSAFSTCQKLTSIEALQLLEIFWLFVRGTLVIEHTVPGAGHNSLHYADAACAVCSLQAARCCHVAWR